MAAIAIGARARLVLALPSQRDHSPTAPGSGQLHFLLGKVAPSDGAITTEEAYVCADLLVAE